MGKPEDFVEKYLMRRCKAMGFGCLKFTSPGTSGVPDRIVIGNGRTVFVETKRAGAKLRRLQEVITAEMRKQGADVRVADTREMVDEFLTEIAGNPAQAAQPGTPDILPLLKRKLAEALPEATPAQIEELLAVSQGLGAALRDQRSDADTDSQMPVLPAGEQQETIIDRVHALADRWASVPALRRGSAARELREALVPAPGS